MTTEDKWASKWAYYNSLLSGLGFTIYRLKPSIAGGYYTEGNILGKIFFH